MVDDEGTGVVGGGATAETAQGRGEPVGASGLDGGGEPGEETVPGPEGERRGGTVEAQGRTSAAGLDGVEEDSREGEFVDRRHAC